MADHLTLLERTEAPVGEVVAPGAGQHQDAQLATSELAVEQRFAVVPEWMLDSAVSDTAFRLYAILARYGNTSGVRMPGRALLARRLHRTVDTVDRALKELTAAGILTVEHRTQAGRTLTNRYHLRTAADIAAGGRTGAAPPSRSPAAPRAAPLRPDPEVPTDTPPPPTTPDPLGSTAQSAPAGAEEALAARKPVVGPQAELLVACPGSCFSQALGAAGGGIGGDEQQGVADVGCGPAADFDGEPDGGGQAGPRTSGPRADPGHGADPERWR